MKFCLLTTVSLLPLVQAAMGPMMGQSNECDDGQNNLEVDWDPADFSVYTCSAGYSYAVREVDPEEYQMPDFDPRKDEVEHKCLNTTINYKNSPPIRGEHRPNWPQYGEYLYVPPQRWLHNLEHGTIVFLYHPCVDEGQLMKLRKIVTSCLYRHIITPYDKLNEERPLALVSWGAKLTMSYVEEKRVVSFIRKHARNAPEDISRQGKYNLHLINPATVVSDQDDNHLCPGYPL